MQQGDRQTLRDTAEMVGGLFEELMALRPANGRPGVRGSLFTPEQAAAIASSCAPDILDSMARNGGNVAEKI